MCTPVVAGEVLACANDTLNPAAFTATGDFNVTMMGMPNPSVMTRNDNNAGFTINGGNFGGEVTMGAGASITTTSGGGSRHGLVIASSAAGTGKTYKIDLDGSIIPNDADGDALRLQGTSFSIFNVTLGENAVLGGGAGDDGIIVTAAQSFSLTNYGKLSGGSGQPVSGGEGVNVGVGVRTAAEGVVVNNYGSIIGTGGSNLLGGQAVSIYGAGDVSVSNQVDGTIEGATQGVRIEADGEVTVYNAGSISSDDLAGVEIADGTTVTVTNFGAGEIEGNDDGVVISGASEDVTVYNIFGGTITGVNNDGVRIMSIEGDVEVYNTFGSSISGADSGVFIEDVDGSVAINNSFGGEIEGGDYGVRISAVEGEVDIVNFFGSISGDEDGINLDDIDDDVTISNSFGSITGANDGIRIFDVWSGNVVVNNRFDGSIVGTGGHGIAIDEIDGSVEIGNSFGGEIQGGDHGIRLSEVEGEVEILNVLGSISGGDDGINIDDIDDDVTIANGFGSITGGDDGIRISDVWSGNVVVNNRFDGSVVGTAGHGISIDEIDGTVEIGNSFGGEIQGGDHGVRISEVDGAVEIFNVLGSISGGEDGINIDDVGDDVTIANSFGSITGGDDGIRISDAWSGNVVINNRFGGSVAGTGGHGISIEDIDGTVEIGNSFGGEIQGDDHGVRMSEVEGEVEIFNVLGSISGGEDGINLDDIDDNVSIANSFGSITGGDDGVRISDVWGGNVAINNRFGGNIVGTGGHGISIDEIDGSVEIRNSRGGEIEGGDHGVRIAEVDGTVDVSNRRGSISGGRDGIHIDDVEGDVTIRNRAGSITGAADGINIDGVDGDVTITNRGGTITGADQGIDLSDVTGDVSIRNGRGEIRGLSEEAIDVEARSVTIASNGLIQGVGTESDPTIFMSTQLKGTITNSTSGRIVGANEAADETIITATGGQVTINNAGTMIGRIDLSGAGNKSGPNTFNNLSHNSWTFIGTSQFGNGLADSFNNFGGTVYTTDPNAPQNNDVTILAGLEAFNNGNGAGSGILSMRDGHTGDVTQIEPTSGGTLMFHGAPGRSFLLVDSFLGTVANSSSDRLEIDGDVSGKTTLVVNNLNAGWGSYNPRGILVVSATGSLPATSLTLSGGPINAGLFDYDLYQRSDNEWVIASRPSDKMFELPSLMSAAQSNWHDVAGVWLDRTADLRAAAPESAIWARVLGSSQSREQRHSFTLFDTTHSTTTGYRQQGYGFVGGADFVTQASTAPGTFVVGVMGGYTGSDVDFDGSSTNSDIRGGMVGGYVTYLEGGWFVDAKVLAHFGDLDYSGGEGVSDSANVRSIGGVLDTGYRMSAYGGFIEPGATLSYVNTDIDNLSIFGTSVGFENGDSLRGRVGLRVGTTLIQEQVILEPFIGASAWYEFLGDNVANVASGGFVVPAYDSTEGVMGEITSGVNIFNAEANDVNGFIKGNFVFGENDLVGYGGSAGVRVNW